MFLVLTLVLIVDAKTGARVLAARPVALQCMMMLVVEAFVNRYRHRAPDLVLKLTFRVKPVGKLADLTRAMVLPAGPTEISLSPRLGALPK